MSFSSLLEAFEALNQKKRDDPKSLSSEENAAWKAHRREIEQLLFQQAAVPEHDTREFVRVPVSLSARYWSRDELRDRYIPVLGDGGLMIATRDPLPVGTVLELEIVVADVGLLFTVQGEVVWARADGDLAGMGVRFRELSYEQKRLIYNLVDDNLRQRLLERRSHGRVNARLGVQVVSADGYFELTTEDLSLGGMFIATDHLLPVGERVQLVLHLGGNRTPIEVDALVIRVVEEHTPEDPAGIGVRFVGMPEPERQILQGLLTDQLKTELAPEGSEGAERRRYARLAQRLAIEFETASGRGICFSRDISFGGVFIQTHEAFPPLGSQIEIALRHPSRELSVNLPGRVVRVVPLDPSKPLCAPGIALAFDDLSDEQRRLLQEILEAGLDLNLAG